jgi:hypothetical protein
MSWYKGKKIFNFFYGKGMAKSWQGCVVLGHGNEVGMPPKNQGLYVALENGK